MPDRAWKGRKKIPGSSGATSPRSAAQPLTNIPGCTGPSLRPAKPNRPTAYDHADLRRRMPQLARAPASLRRPGALQQGGALYCACERQRATGAIAHCSMQLGLLSPAINSVMVFVAYSVISSYVNSIFILIFLNYFQNQNSFYSFYKVHNQGVLQLKAEEI